MGRDVLRETDAINPAISREEVAAGRIVELLPLKGKRTYTGIKHRREMLENNW
jgi:hypothetical protein